MAVVHLRKSDVTVRSLLAQIADSAEEIDAVIVAVRRNGRWETVYTSTALGGLAMGAMKIFRDISDTLEDDG